MKKIIFLLSILMLFNIACHKKESGEKAGLQNPKEDQSYRTDTVKLKNVTEDLILNGEVSFDENSVVRVFPLVSGNVEDVKVSLGAYVKKGQSLVSIRSADVTNYIKDFEVDKSNLEIAKKNLQNVESLYKSGFSSETDYINSKQEFIKAQQSVARSQQVLRLYGGASKSDQPYFIVQAPISGYVVEKNVNTGQEMRPDNSSPMFTISNLSKIWILANVYETDISDIKLGQTVDVRTLSYPDKSFPGKISNISNVLDKNSRVMKVRVEMDNKDGFLKPDMFATIHLKLSQPGQMLSVPLKAIVFDNDKYFVVVDTGNKKYEKRSVEILKSTSEHVFLKGNLKSGEIVVTEGSLLLFNELNS